MNCFQPAAGPTCFVMLGKFGDLIHMLPVFLHTFKRDKVKPVVMVSDQFASVLDGVSYVTPWVVPMKWPDELNAALNEAKKHFVNPIVPQFWNIPIPQEIIESEDANCTLAMWKSCGIDRQYFASSPVVFDRRDPAREEFVSKTAGHYGRPVILYNLEGASCPFPFAAEVLQTLRLLKGNAELVDLAAIRCDRIYDLLGLYDRAVGMVTVDTATLHLAGTGGIPYVALLNDGWSRAEPKGRCVLSLPYSESRERMNEIAQEVLKFATVARTRKPIVRNLDDPPGITKQTHWPVRILAEFAEGR